LGLQGSKTDIAVSSKKVFFFSHKAWSRDIKHVINIRPRLIYMPSPHIYAPSVVYLFLPVDKALSPNSPVLADSFSLTKKRFLEIQ
jgi:hypothetical protein